MDRISKTCVGFMLIFLVSIGLGKSSALADVAPPQITAYFALVTDENGLCAEDGTVIPKGVVVYIMDEYKLESDYAGHKKGDIRLWVRTEDGNNYDVYIGNSGMLAQIPDNSQDGEWPHYKGNEQDKDNNILYVAIVSAGALIFVLIFGGLFYLRGKKKAVSQDNLSEKK